MKYQKLTWSAQNLKILKNDAQISTLIKVYKIWSNFE